MKLTPTWYPLQLFVRKWEIVTPLIASFIAMVGLTGWIEYGLRHVPQPVFLHYSIELGVDDVGSRITALTLPAIVIGIVVLNGLLANLLILNQRGIARVLVWSTVPMAIAAWALSALILRVNGA